MPEIQEGLIKWYDPKKGYGFIVNGHGEDVFFHHTALPGGEYRKTVFEGDEVTYIEQTKPAGELHTLQIISVKRELKDVC